MLGHPTVQELLRQGHHVTAVTRQPQQAETSARFRPERLDVSRATDAQLRHLLTGTDAVVYALGPDDRSAVEGPALAYFRQHLVAQTAKVLQAAQAAGVRRAVIFGSYFSTFERQHPEWQLAAHHPYIQARKEQAREAIAAGQDTMFVCILEIPYVFGVTPGREPFWKEVLFDRVLGQKRVFYPKGGTAVVTSEQVAQSAVYLVQHGQHGEHYPIADVNMDWNTLIATIQTAAGEQPHVTNAPQLAAQLAMYVQYKQDQRAGKEMGLHPLHLMPDIMYRHLYLDTENSQATLGFSSGGVDEAIRATVKDCFKDARP